jgi:hypothetical protein
MAMCREAATGAIRCKSATDIAVGFLQHRRTMSHRLPLAHGSFSPDPGQEKTNEQYKI